MRFDLLLANGVILGMVGLMAAFGGVGVEVRELLPRKAGPSAASAGLAELETEVAHAPTVRAVASLAGAYLERNQPGLASAVIEKAPRALREQPEVAEVYARTLFRRGHARKALAVAREAGEACVESESCAPWVLLKTARQVAFLEQVVAAGIEDPDSNPAAIAAAYHRSAREVGMVAMR